MTDAREHYLAAAAKATRLDDKAFYELMAEVSPRVTAFMVKHATILHGPGVYKLALSVTACLLAETCVNVCNENGPNINAILRDFRAAFLIVLKDGDFERLEPTPIEPAPVKQ